MRPFRSILLAALPLALPLTSCAHGQGDEGHEGTEAPQGPQPGSIRLILNDPTGRSAPLDECDVELCTSLVELIDGAEKTIDFAIYGMRNQSAVRDALARAKERGVAIRGIVDRDLEGKNYYSSTEELVALIGDVRSDQQADEKLTKIEEKRRKKSDTYEPICPQPPGFNGFVQCLAYDLGDQCLFAAHSSREELAGTGEAIMHDKFFVVDTRYVWTGSTNASDSGTGGYNANLVTVVDSRKVASWYLREFDQMYVEGKHHGLKEPSPKMKITLEDGAELEVLFSPQDKPITKAVRPLLRGAKERIDVGIFFLTHKAITRDLIEAHQRGVKVRVIMDATAAKNGYAKHELLRAVGIPVKVENWGGKMHAKSAAIDGKHVITGSMNWTSAGEGGNDENTIIVHSEKLARQYHDYFDTIWAKLPDELLTTNPDPEGPISTTACTDGVDNDYDHKPDAEDPGCGDNPPPLPPLPPHKIVPKGERVTCSWADQGKAFAEEIRAMPAPESDGSDTEAAAAD